MDGQDGHIGLIYSIRELQLETVVESDLGYDVSEKLEELEGLLEEVAGTCPYCHIPLHLEVLGEFRGEEVVAWECSECAFHEIE